MKDQLEQRVVNVGDLRESPHNPRKTYGDLGELVASMKRHGIMQPLMVRETDDGLEVVFGHRRLRAAKQVGMKQIPVIVRNLDDAQVLEAQLIENAQREDIHPMEEAEAYARLHTEFKYSVDQIADRVGKTRASVYARMKLVDLTEPARKAFLRGDLDASRALLVARLKGENTQKRALDAITVKNRRGDMPSYREAAELIERRFGRVKAEDPDGRTAKTAERKQTAAEEAEGRRRAARATITRAVTVVEQRRDLETADLRIIILALVKSVPIDGVLARRGWEKADHLINAVAKKLTQAELRALLFEIAVTPWVGDSSREFTPELKTLAKGFDLNLRQIEAEARYDIEEAAKKANAEALFAKGTRH